MQLDLVRCSYSTGNSAILAFDKYVERKEIEKKTHIMHTPL